jgi:hypothetical protein
MARFSLKIVSGGQPGVDRAALDAAIEHGLPLGGWVPRGRLAEDGPLDDKYVVRETPSEERDITASGDERPLIDRFLPSRRQGRAYAEKQPRILR